MAHGDITHIDIPAEDVERARNFYSSLIGWQINEAPGYEGYPMWQAPNKISGGGIASRAMGIDRVRSYIEVDSIDQVLGRVQELGGKVLMDKSEISPTSWYAVFEDTEGNQMGLYEGVTDPGAAAD
jgi:predicted enzyme related to lactoylglutathione lyase